MLLRHLLTTATLTVALVAVAGGDAVGAQPVRAAEEVAASTTWSVAPASPDGPDGRVSFRLELEPGAVHEDHIVVTNFSTHPATFALRAADGTLGPDGVFTVVRRAEASQAAGTWIEVADEVTVDGGVSVVVPWRLTVPTDALPGDHPAGIVASLASGADGEIAVDTGVGARVHLRVGGDVVPAVVLADVRTAWTPSWNPLEPGVLELHWTVVNEGDVRLGASQVLDVVGPLGSDPGVARQVLASQPELLPGHSGTFRASVEAWPLGRLAATLTSTPTVLGEDRVDAPLRTHRADVVVWAVPWVHVGGLLVLLACGAALVLRRRRRRAVGRAFT